MGRVDDELRVFAVDHARGLVGMDRGRRVGAGPNVVDRVVGVDEVAAVARVDHSGLVGRPARRVVVAPDHVAGGAAVDRVVAVAAEQVIVHAGPAHEHVVTAGGPLVHD